MPHFKAISDLSGGQPWTWYFDREYPYDLNGALDFTRPKTGESIHPFPVMTSFIPTFSPLLDAVQYSLMLGRNPNGPEVNLLNSSPNVAYVFPDIFSMGMQKVDG